MTPFIQMALSLIELAADVGPHLIEAIESSVDLSDEAKKVLMSRVDAARGKVEAYVPRDV